MSARGAMITVLATGLSNAVRADEEGEGHDIGAGMFGPAVSAWIRNTVDQFMEATGMKPDCTCAAPPGMPHTDTCRTKYSQADAAGDAPR